MASSREACIGRRLCGKKGRLSSGLGRASGDLSYKTDRAEPQTTNNQKQIPHPHSRKRAYHPNTRRTGVCWGPRHWVRNDSGLARASERQKPKGPPFARTRRAGNAQMQKQIPRPAGLGMTTRLPSAERWVARPGTPAPGPRRLLFLTCAFAPGWRAPWATECGWK